LPELAGWLATAVAGWQVWKWLIFIVGQSGTTAIDNQHLIKRLSLNLTIAVV